MEIYTKVKLKKPQYPNFILTEAGQDAKIPVADLTDEQVEDYIAFWEQGFREHVQNKRANNV